jgi:hypothetical protein
MAKPIQDGTIPIQNFNASGLAFSKWSGIKDSLYKFIGFDPHSEPGILNVEQKLTKDSGSVVDEFCRARVNCSNGIRYWFSYTSGKIWQDKAGTYTLVYTTSPAAGDVGCLGAKEYNGYIYWATQSRLHRIAVASADGSTSWTANAAPNWKTFTNTDSEFHPMFVHPDQQTLYIGDANLLAQVDDSGTFTANALDIISPLRIKSLGQFSTDILLGTIVDDNVDQTQIIRWNCYSVSFTNSDPIPEVGINAFLPADNMVLVQAGKAGNIYYYDGTNLLLYGKIPGTYSATAYGEVYFDSVSNNAGQILFGFSNGSGNPADQLIYRIAKYNKDFNYIMDQPYPCSARNGDEFVLTDLEFGGIMVSGQTIYVSVTDGDTCWIDKTDPDNKLDGAYFETRTMIVNRVQMANFSEAYMAYADLPASTDIDFYIDKNYAGYGSALNKVDDTDRLIVQTSEEGTEFNVLQLKVKITTSGNYAPKIESGAVVIR